MSCTVLFRALYVINDAAVLLPQFGCFQVVAPAASTAFCLGKRRSLSTAAPALVVVFSLAWAAGLGLRRIHAGISGRRRRGRRSGALLRVQACRPVRPTSVSNPVAPSAPGERSAGRRPAWSRAADLFCPSFLHHTRRPAPVSSAKTAVPPLRSGGSASLEFSLSVAEYPVRIDFLAA